VENVSIGAGTEELRDCKQFNPQEGRKFPVGAKGRLKSSTRKFESKVRSLKGHKSNLPLDVS